MPAGGSSELQSSQAQALERLGTLIRRLKPLDRQIMVLRVFEQMRWDDIAHICGKTERCDRSRVAPAAVNVIMLSAISAQPTTERHSQ